MDSSGTIPAPDGSNLLTGWDYIGIIAYLGLMVYMGWHFSRRQTDTDQYFVAHRSLPGWAVGISIFATLLSSFTFIAFPGWTFDRSWEILMREGMAPLAIFLAAIFIIPLYRRAIRMSAYEYLEKRFGYLARLYGTLGFLFGHYFKIAVVMYTMSVALGAITGWNVQLIILVLGLITVVYTTVGGIEGVIWTDVIQGLLMLGSGLLAILFILFFASDDGPVQIFATAIDADKFKMIDTSFTWQSETVWVFASIGLYHFVSKYMTDQTMVQRYLLAKSIGSTVRAMAVSMLCCVLAWTMFSLIGTLLWSFYELNPDRIVARVLEDGDGVLKGDKVFPMFVGSELPPFLTGIILAGLAAATMSTLSSDLNSIGAVGVSDFYDRFAKKPTEAKRLTLSKILVVSSGLGAIGIGLLLTLYQGGIMQMTMDVGAFLGSVIGGGLLAMYLLGVFSPRTSKRGLYVGIAVGFVFTVWCMFTAGGQIATTSAAEAAIAAGKSGPFLTIPDSWSSLVFTPKIWWLPIFSNTLTFIVAYGASLLMSPGHRAPERLVVTHLRDLWLPEEELEAKAAIPAK